MSQLLNFLEASTAPREPVRAPKVPPTKAATETPSAGPASPSVGGTLGSLLDAIESNAGDDPLTVYIRRQVLSDALGFVIPTRAELEMQQVQADIQMREVRRKQAGLMVSDAYAWLLDNDPSVNGDILSDPAALIAKVNLNADKLGFSLTPGILELAGLPAVRETTGERLAKQSANLQNAERVGKAIEAGGQGEGILGQQLDAASKAASERFGGVNLGGGIFDESDTDKGSQAAFAKYLQFRDSAEPVVGRSGAAQTFLAQNAENLKDQLEGLPTDDQGRLIVGVGDAGVTPAATFNLSLLVREVARDLGVSDDKVLTQLGLEYTGFNEASLLSQAVELAPEWAASEIAAAIESLER